MSLPDFSQFVTLRSILTRSSPPDREAKAVNYFSFRFQGECAACGGRDLDQVGRRHAEQNFMKIEKMKIDGMNIERERVVGRENDRSPEL